VDSPDTSQGAEPRRNAAPTSCNEEDVNLRTRGSEWLTIAPASALLAAVNRDENAQRTVRAALQTRSTRNKRRKADIELCVCVCLLATQQQHVPSARRFVVDDELRIRVLQFNERQTSLGLTDQQSASK
jgi:hypothetical protein